jgi:hypothetical protein
MNFDFQTSNDSTAEDNEVEITSEYLKAEGEKFGNEIVSLFVSFFDSLSKGFIKLFYFLLLFLEKFLNLI